MEKFEERFLAEWKQSATKIYEHRNFNKLIEAVYQILPDMREFNSFNTLVKDVFYKKDFFAIYKLQTAYNSNEIRLIEESCLYFRFCEISSNKVYDKRSQLMTIMPMLFVM